MVSPFSGERIAIGKPAGFAGAVAVVDLPAAQVAGLEVAVCDRCGTGTGGREQSAANERGSTAILIDLVQ